MRTPPPKLPVSTPSIQVPAFNVTDQLEDETLDEYNDRLCAMGDLLMDMEDGA